MPELPEVETVARQLRPALVGSRVRALELAWSRTLVEDSPGRCAHEISGRRCTAIDRRAKYLLLRFGADRTLLVHLRMTGRLSVRAEREPVGAWRRAALLLDRARRLDFDDPRKFGRWIWTASPERELAQLGPEPLGSAFDAAWLHAALRARRARLKPLLLDQSFLAGLGNIYVDEALHRARLHPLRSSDSVAAAEAEALHRAIVEVLSEAIEREGSSFDVFYRTPAGEPGSFQDSFRVYDRAGEPCVACGAAIVRLEVGQRGTHFCPRCQKPPRARRARSALSSGTASRGSARARRSNS
ncbi:MAG: bifunctional DNA-formamidopyrimidine glycosylase/DNA-(apurinic or apyrimidinic site) lyase [Planctomycetes bacterium]|nr:bifunctional DNA-formamidopyrimidine glycosylase/DNA-(apurinic or apyrimidinic site) lyase [Planctomycetota bacterium]